MSAPSLWVRVTDRAGLDAARRSGAASVLVIDSESPLYGQPGDQLCIRLSDRDLSRPAGQLAPRLPLRAGILYRPGPQAEALVVELARRGRQPLAAEVASAAEAQRALAAGATAIVVHDAALVRALTDSAEAQGTRRAHIVGVISGSAEAGLMVTAGAHALLVAQEQLAGLLATPAFAALVAPGGRSQREPARSRMQPRATTAAAAGTIGAALDRAARAFAQREALVHVSQGRRLSYAELAAEARRVGQALMAYGVTPGERIVVWARNAAEWPLLQLGAAYAGVIVATANASLSDDELEQILDNCGAAMLFAGAHRTPRTELLERLAAEGKPRGLRHVVVLPEVATVPRGAQGWDQFLAAAASVGEADLARVSARCQPDDVIMILYTSGTTGTPKGVQLTHRAMLQNAAAVGANIRLSTADRLCLPVPFHHCFGAVMGTLASLTYGASMVLPAEFFDAGAVLRAVAGERCTALYGVPTMFLALLEHPDRPRTDLSSLRTGIIAGAPVPLDLGRRASHELHLPQLVVAYGLTEAAPVVTQTSIDDQEEIRLGTVGRPILGAETRAIDPRSGKVVPVGTPGELVTRGPMIMRGYFDMPGPTAEAIDRQGWLHTGDQATVDEHGVWRIVGRIKDLIIRGGENIDPAAIEAAGRQHSGVAEMYVVGVPSDYYGEEIFAFVRPAAGARLSEDDLRRHLGERLGRFEVPRYIHFVDSFPMTESGKIQKSRLREQARQLVGGGARPEAASRPDSAGRLTPDGQDARRAPAATERPTLPLLPPKRSSGSTDLGRIATSGTNPPSDTDEPTPGSHSASLPPHPAWRPPDRPGWRWRPRKELTDMPNDRTARGATEDAPASQTDLDELRRRGQRIKTWGIVGDIREQIEATGEEPIMYKALGTPAQTHHPFNLYGDIKSQPSALRETFEHADEIRQVARDLAGRNFTGIFGLGSGTSQFVAQVANAAFARFAGIPGWDYDSQAFLRYPPPFDYSKMLAVAYSGSGSTVDTVAAARESRQRGAYTLSLTSVEGSPVVQATDARILTAGGFDTGGSDTFHYTTRIAAAIYLALELGKLRNPGAHDYEGLQRQLLETPQMMADMFDAVDKRCRTIADMFLGVRSVLVVGAGANYGTAEEIALKFDEMSHIPAKAMNPGRHIHGALGLTEESILTILVAPPGDSYKDLHDIARVTEQLKSPAVAIVSEKDEKIADIVDYVVRLPIEDETLFTVLAVLPGQLMPYYCGVGLGLNPDTQRSNVPKHARVWNMLFPPGTH